MVEFKSSQMSLQTITVGMKNLKIHTLPPGLKEAWLQYTPQLKEGQHILQSSNCRDLKTRANAIGKIGLQYLNLITHQHFTVFGNEDYQEAEHYFKGLLQHLQSVHSISSHNLGTLVYHVHFAMDLNKLTEFCDTIKGLLTQIKYNDIFPTPGLLTQKPLDQQFLIQLQEVAPIGGKETNLVNIGAEELTKKLDEFCNSSDDGKHNLIDSIQVYISRLGNMRSEVTELCHQFGLAHPTHTKTEENKAFRVKSRIDFSGKLTGLKNVLYEQQGVSRNVKAGILSNCERLLRRFYCEYPRLWERFREIKKRKNIVL